jgi:hypothetical protein
MSKKYILTLAAGLTIGAAGAQEAATFAIDFVTGVETYTLKDNPWIPAMEFSNEAINGRIYRHAHFSALPNGAERAELAAKGVDLLYFESGTTYVASIATGTTFPIPNTKLAGLTFISGRCKMIPELLSGIGTKSFPSFATDENGNIGITFMYYADIPHSYVMDQLKLMNYNTTYDNANSHRITVWMPNDRVDGFCSLPFVSFAELLDDVPQPDNNPGRTDHRINWMAQDFPGGNMYNGDGVNVMLQDDGYVGPHIDYTGRLTQFIPSNSGNHGDHCGGIIAGGGNKDPLTRGMGWGAQLNVYGAVPYTGWDSIYTHYFTRDITIISTSYSDGCNAGYTTLSQEMDQMAIDMPNLINVFSAGNNGGVDCQYGAGSAYGNVTGGHKHSKNSIAVGNLDYLDNLNTSSSVGPVHDGRMKPEVCAVGTNVNSTVDPNDYELKTGTSMSCPAVSGTFSCMSQAYREIHGTTPKSGLLKAILMNTCDDLLNPGPDFKTGYGRINARRALTVIEDANYITDSIDNVQQNTHTISVPASVGTLKVLIYWHDAPAAVNANVALVNNINMTVTNPASTVLNPLVLDYTPTVAALSANAVPGIDIRNNHEQVTIQNPAAGTYTVTVNGAAIPSGPQTYFITWYFEPLDELVITYPNGGEGFAPGEGQTVRWDAQNLLTTVSLEYTVDGGLTWNPMASNLPSGDLAYGWTVPAGLSGDCRVRIFSPTTADTSDADFTIAAIPANVTVAWACPDSLCLKWDTIAGGTSYDVFMLGSVYMDSVANSLTDSVVITGLNNNTNTYWFSVRSRYGPTNGIGRRAIAIEKTPGVFCPGAYDASVSAADSPMQNYVSCMTLTNIPVIVDITNPGLTPLTNVPVSFSYDGGTPVNETFTGTVAPLSTATYTFTATVNVGAAGNHTLESWTTYPTDIASNNDTFTLAINHFTNTTVAPPFTQNFETFATCGVANDCGVTNCLMIAGWYNIPNGEGDDIDWRTDEGGTVTSNTGPSNDFNPGTSTGNYLYLEASACEYATAELLSPCIDLSTFVNPHLLYAYHMYGSGMGSMHIDIYSNGQWVNDFYVRNGSQSQNWLQADLNLSAFIGQTIIIRYRGVTGTGGLSDMAIDFVRVEDPTSTADYNAASLVNVYPNPAQGLFNFSAEGLNNEQVTATVYDITGRVVFSQNYGEQFGTFQSVIDLTGFENGTYLLELSIGESVAVQRLVKEE